MLNSDLEEERTDFPNKYRYSSLVRQDHPEMLSFDFPLNSEPAGHPPGVGEQAGAGPVQHGGHPELHPQHQHQQQQHHPTATVSQTALSLSQELNH